jgi:hypothetical protein
MSAYCASCDRQVRISETAAFGGRDALRITLICGHLVCRPVEGCEAHLYSDRISDTVFGWPPKRKD